MPPGYAFFAIQRVKDEVVTEPDGTRSFHEPGAGQRVVEQRRGQAERGTAKRERAAEDAHRQRTAEWNEHRQRWIDQLSLETVETLTRGHGKRRAPTKYYVDRVTFPDGGVEEFFQSNTKGEIEARYTRDHPLPRRPSARQDAAPHAALPTWRAERTWRAELFLPTGRQALPMRPLSWPYGFPMEEVMNVLNDLAQDGWSVLHVSEDRGLYTGADTPTDSGLTSVRYLLRRDH